MLSIFAILLFSCKKDKDSVHPKLQSNQVKSQQTAPAEKIVLGKQLENPYTIKNMEQAYNNVVSNSTARTLADPSPRSGDTLLCSVFT